MTPHLRSRAGLMLAGALVACGAPPGPTPQLTGLRERIDSLTRALARSETERLLAQAELAIERDPGDALLLAINSARHGVSPKTGSLLQAAMEHLHERRTLRGHTAPVTSVAFSPDGARLLTTADDGTARVWQTSDGALLATLEEAQGRLIEAVFSPDGSRVVTRSTDAWHGTSLWNAGGTRLATLVGARTVAFTRDGQRVVAPTRGATITVFAAADGRELDLLQPHLAPIASALPTGDGSAVLSAAADGSVQLTRVADGTALLALRRQAGKVNSARFDPAGQRILTACSDRRARLWNARTGALLVELGPESAPLTDARFNDDGTLIATFSARRAVARTRRLAVWDAATGELAYRLEEPVAAATFAGEDALVTASDTEPVLTVRDASSGTERARLRGHAGPITDLAAHPDRPWIASSGSDHTARLWNLEAATARDVRRHGAPVVCAAFGPEGLVVTGDAAGRALAGAFDREPQVLETHEATVWAVDCSADGTRVVTASHDGSAAIWDLETGLEEHLLEDHDDVVRSASFSPDGTRVLTASYDGTAALWNAEDGARVAALTGHDAPLSSARFDPLGQWIATTADEAIARLWTADGRPHAELGGHDGPVLGAAFDDTGARVVTLDSRAARIWTCGDGLVAHVVRLRERPTCAVFSPDGTSLVIGNTNGRLHVFATADGTRLTTRDAHADAVTALDATADAILSAGRDGVARLWRGATLAPVTAFEGHTATVTSAAFAPGGDSVVTTSEDGTARRWSIDRLALARRLAAGLTRDRERR